MKKKAYTFGKMGNLYTESLYGLTRKMKEAYVYMPETNF